MKELLENAYEEFAMIVEGSWKKEVKDVLLKNLYDRLGPASTAFDNMVYERMGVSADEALEMIHSGDILP